MGNQRVDPEKIHLNGVRILRARFEVNDEALDDIPEVARFQTGLKSESAFNLEEGFHRFKLFVKIQGLDENEKPVGVNGEYHIDFYYTVDNLKDFITYEKGDEDFSVGDDLGATIAGISYSTARGIILNRTYSTDFNGILLPIINPHKLLGEDTFTELYTNASH